jgi:hypothetical protein
MQRRRCLDGSDTMLIWLGKVVLHQKESSGITLEATDTLAEFINSIRKAPRHRVTADYAEANGERS